MERKLPMCEKVASVSDESQAIGDFLDWLRTVHGTVQLPTSIQRLLEQYYEIDPEQLEAERRYLLRCCQRAEQWKDLA